MNLSLLGFSHMRLFVHLQKIHKLEDVFLGEIFHMDQNKKC